VQRVRRGLSPNDHRRVKLRSVLDRIAVLQHFDRVKLYGLYEQFERQGDVLGNPGVERDYGRDAHPNHHVLPDISLRHGVRAKPEYDDEQ
jgi:hypothetical protein